MAETIPKDINVDINLDIVVIGGGIAGLWLLDRLKKAGFAALLLNKGPLGQGQSIAAQGIIHSGTKYFGGETSVADLEFMPARWRACLSGGPEPSTPFGANDPDLSAVAPLSEAMKMWLPPQLGGGLLAGFSQKIMRSQMLECPPEDRPGVLPNVKNGKLFATDELVVDVPKILSGLQNLNSNDIRALPDGVDITFGADTKDGVTITAGPVSIKAQRLICTAGAGNEALLASLGLANIATQRRPLHQVIVGNMQQPLFLHCIGRNPKPLATITSHPDGGGGYYWYIGGLIAEQGATQDPDKLITTAQAKLQKLLPNADFTQARWATHRVDRAEPAGHGGHVGFRPGSVTAQGHGAIIVGWPTKLALAPVLSDHIMAMLDRTGIRPNTKIGTGTTSGTTYLSALPRPGIAKTPWDAVETWN